jgi:hypothetical protein
MNRLLWAALIVGVALLLFVRWVQAWGAPLVIIVMLLLFAFTLKMRNRYVGGHRASGIDELNQPGRAVTVDDRTSRWWDAEQEMAPGRARKLLGKIIPYRELRIGSLDKARKQQRDQHAGRPVRPIDWTAPNRNGGAAMGGGMTASGMTYDWCTCSEQAMPLIEMADGSKRYNNGAETCLCQCSSCAPKGRYRDADGKMQPIQAQHWRARDAEHEMAVNLAMGHAYQRRLSVRLGHAWDEVVARVEDRRQARRDADLAAAVGYIDIGARRRRGESVITDTDEWHYARGADSDADPDGPDLAAQGWRTGRHANTDNESTDPINPEPGGHE